MYKIGIIGGRETTLCFLSLGFTVFEAETPDAAREALHRAATGGEFAVLFVEDALASRIATDIAKYEDEPLPAITVIPGKDGGTGMGASHVKKAVERAVGADILLNNERG